MPTLFAPGPEILDTYVPTDYLLDGNPGIATIPEYPEHLLRWWPRHQGVVLDRDSTVLSDDSTKICQHPDILAETLKLADQEFAQLPEYGIKTPIPGVDITRFIADASHVALEGLVEYSIVRRFKGHLLDKSDPRGVPLVEGYSRYLQDAAISGQLLYDLCKPQQHLVGLDEIPILIDTEPLATHTDTLMKARETQKYETAIAHAAGHLHAWGVNLDLSGPDMDAVHDLAFV